MVQILISLAVWVLGHAVARILAGAGLAIGSYSVISDWVNNALSALSSGISSLGATGQLLYLAGIGQVISIFGSAVLAAVAIRSAKIFLTGGK